MNRYGLEYHEYHMSIQQIADEMHMHTRTVIQTIDTAIEKLRRQAELNQIAFDCEQHMRKNK